MKPPPVPSHLVTSIAAVARESGHGLVASCPDCELGRQARRDFWNDAPAYYAAVIVLPFALVALVSRLLAGGLFK
jgi:hypothetical protein